MFEEKNLKSTILHPYFKNFAFRKDKRSNSKIRNEMIDSLAEEIEESHAYREYAGTAEQSSSSSIQFEKLKKFEEFFTNQTATTSRNQNIVLSGKQILHAYLLSPNTSFTIFQQFPLLKTLSMKYNTPIPSSAPSERLFSVAKHILTAHRCKLTDDHFEQRLLLKTNRFV